MKHDAQQNHEKIDSGSHFDAPGRVREVGTAGGGALFFALGRSRVLRGAPGRFLFNSYFCLIFGRFWLDFASSFATLNFATIGTNR